MDVQDKSTPHMQHSHHAVRSICLPLASDGHGPRASLAQGTLQAIGPSTLEGSHCPTCCSQLGWQQRMHGAQSEVPCAMHRSGTTVQAGHIPVQQAQLTLTQAQER